MAQTETSRRKLIDILAQVSNETGVSVTDITGPTKRALYVEARSFFARLAHGEGYKLIDIGEALGGRSHTAVLEYLKDEGGSKDMTKEDLKKRVAGLNKEERKALVQEIAESGTKEERDALASLFSGAQGGPVADVETPAAGRAAREQVHEETSKKKSWSDDLDDI